MVEGLNGWRVELMKVIWIADDSNGDSNVGWFEWEGVEWLNGWMVEWLNGCMVERLNGWKVEWLKGWMVELLYGCMVELFKDYRIIGWNR